MDSFSDPDHIPVFLNDVVASASADVLAVCGEDVACIFDFSQTGSESVAMATMETNAVNRMTREQSRKLTKEIEAAS